MRPSAVLMTIPNFLDGLARFQRDVLPSFPGVRIERPDEHLVFMVWKERVIGSATYRRGAAYFDPLPAFEGIAGEDAWSIFGDWAGRAFRAAAGSSEG